MARVYWSRTDFAKHLGVQPTTLSKYKLPPPDVLIGTEGRRTAGWLPETVEEWAANRPGRGARTDLKK